MNTTGQSEENTNAMLSDENMSAESTVVENIEPQQSLGAKAKFFAFISHKSSDSAFALKLQKYIESYNLPASIRTKANAPKRLSPLCSYEVDFSCNPLQAEMEEKLRSSEYLIILCSEELIKQGSTYVDYEIETFIQQKKSQGVDPASRIIPIILSGEFDSDEHECCPQSLKNLGDMRPIAVDRNKCKNDKEVFLYAISAMLNIDFAVLRDRDKKRVIRRRISLAVACVAVIVLGIFLYDYYVPKTYHYLDYTLKEGVPVGICELSEDEYSQVSAHYVITTQKRKVIKLEYVNSCGKLIEHDGTWQVRNRPSKCTFEYGESGRLSEVTYYDSKDMPYVLLQYSSDLKAADLKNPLSPDKPYYIGADDSDATAITNASYTEGNGGISRYEYEYDEDGYIVKEFFRKDSSGKSLDFTLIHGLEYVRDQKGRITEVFFLSAKGERILNSSMIYSKKIVYDDSDNLVEIGDYDSSGALVKDYDFFALIDEYADENDTQVVLMKAYFDDNHNQISQEYYDAMGQLTVDTDTNYAAVVKMTYKNGLLQSTKRYDENGYPLITDGYCGQRYTYDENGYISTVTFTDDKGMPAKSEAYGYVTEKRVNDDRGNPIEAEYLDGFGKTLDTALGYAKIEMEYNKRNQKVREIYYNADGTRSDLGGMGISETRCEYNDEFGRQTLVSYFDADGNPAVSPVDADAHKAVIVYTEGDFVDTVEYKKYTIDSRLLKIRKKIYQNGMLVSDKIHDAEGNLMRVVYDTEFTNTSDTRKSIMKAYNEQGVIETLTEMEFTVDGIPVKRVDCSYYDYLSDKLKDNRVS